MEPHQQLKYYREKAGMTQQQVADLVHISRNTYTQYENGTRGIQADMFFRIAHVLGVSFSVQEKQTLQKKMNNLRHLQEDFLQQVENGNVVKVREYIEAGMNIETKDENGRRIFKIACQNNNYDMVKYLYQAGAIYQTISELDQVDYYDRMSPLQKAAQMKDNHTLRALLECGVGPNEDEDDYPDTALFYACFANNLEGFQLLVAHGADLKDFYQAEPILRWVHEKTFLEYLLEHFDNQLNDENRRILYRKLGRKYEPKGYAYEVSWGYEIAQSEIISKIEQTVANQKKKGKDEFKTLYKIAVKYQNSTWYLYPLAHYYITKYQKMPILVRDAVLAYVNTDIYNGRGVFGDDVMIYEELKEQLLKVEIF